MYRGVFVGSPSFSETVLFYLEINGDKAVSMLNLNE